jgi:hypothetical protein
MCSHKNCILLSVLLTVLLLSPLVSVAQYSGYSSIANLTDFKKEFAIQSSKINSIQSNFTQEKMLSALTEKITSHGNFRFKRQNKVKI